MSGILVIAGAALLSSAGPAPAQDIEARGAVAPGDLITEAAYFRYPYEGCYDAYPTVDAGGWYEDVAAARIPGSEFRPTVATRRTSADVGFYVDEDATDGYVVLDLYVLYGGCPDGSALRVHYGLFRWRVDTSLESESVHLPAGGVVGALGLGAIGAGFFAAAQRRSTGPRLPLGSLTAPPSARRGEP